MQTKLTFALLALTLTGGCTAGMVEGGPTGGNQSSDHDGGTNTLTAPDGATIINFEDMARNTTSCSGGGTTCTSGNPGACNDGIVTCDGTKAMCTPNSMVQSCYSGPAGTAGVGICASGTQSCIGTLGACQGEVLPAAKEDCSNDLDDDCDGKVNNGCPGAMDIGNTRVISPLAGGTDGSIANNANLNVRCPANAFVTSLTIEFYDPQQQIAGLRIGCSTATLSRGTNGTYTATMTALTPAPYASLLAAGGDGTGTPIVLSCAGAGLSGLFGVKGTYDVGGFLGFFGRCGTAALSLNPDNTLKVAMTASAGVATPAGSTAADGYSGFDYATTDGLTHSSVDWGTCAANEVIVGFNGNVSICGTITPSAGGATVPASCLDNVQPVCAALSPTSN